MNNVSLEEKTQQRRTRKIYLLIVMIIITTVILITGTYAWFVGITSVSVGEFQIGVSSGDGLELSLDANSWNTSLSITQAAITTNLNTSYSTHKNKWPTTSLAPISSSGDIEGVGRLKIFGKGALASSEGGYRLISSQLSNTTAEDEGYIAFDLFIRNGNRSNYIGETYNDANDEPVYLLRTSASSAQPSGSQTDDYGLANSVRVAFAQIGRVKSNGTAAATAQGIKCSDNATGVTGLCSDAGTTIWEPNDTKHNTNLIAHYTAICRKKTVSGTNTTYSGNCGTVANDNFYPTYTVKQNITSSMNVDIYDGQQYNNYTGSITSGYLNATDTLTDTEKNYTGNQRPILLKLAANSITKVRVYVYLEGQDVDNYDLITNGNTVKVNFGFTKDKFSSETSAA